MISLKDTIATKEYNFIRENEFLQDKILFLTFGGSHAYGTNIETSDIDVRGVTLNTKSNLIGMSNFEQFINNETDTTIYAFNKFINLIINCNPNTIELLGCKEYENVSKIGQELLDNKKMFLSQKASYSFGGYATAQLRRLQNNLARHTISDEEKEKHMLQSCMGALMDFGSRYTKFDDGSIKLFIDKARNEDLTTEIFADINLSHFPIRDYHCIINDLNSIIKDYNKLNQRNKKKDDLHLNKHAMHLIRLYLMCIDILEKEEINTFRGNDIELLMSIRNGKFQKDDGSYNSDFFDLLDSLDSKMQYAKENTSLPTKPNMKQIEEFVMSVNERVIKDDC